MTTLGRQSEKRAAIEAAVLRATEELLREGASFAELGIERIATRAGISRTAFYFYFRDKRELLVRLTENVNADVLEAADAWWSGEADLRTALGRISAIYAEHGAVVRAVVEVSTYDAEIAAFWRGLVGRFVDTTRETIERERPGLESAEAISFALCWMVERAFYQQLAQGRPEYPEQLVEALALIFERTVYDS